MKQLVTIVVIVVALILACKMIKQSSEEGFYNRPPNPVDMFCDLFSHDQSNCAIRKYCKWSGNFCSPDY